ncbi:MAG: response regulator [Parvularculaceae bacterium]
MAQCLVIDDSDVIRFVLSRILGRLGHQAIDTKDIAEAVENCRAGSIDVVFVDWDMPGLVALEFLKGVAQLPSEQRPEIVLCATENDPQQFALAKAAGAGQHILKPYDVTTIRAMLKHIGLHQPETPVDEDETGNSPSMAQAG